MRGLNASQTSASFLLSGDVAREKNCELNTSFHSFAQSIENSKLQRAAFRYEIFTKLDVYRFCRVPRILSIGALHRSSSQIKLNCAKKKKKLNKNILFVCVRVLCGISLRAPSVFFFATFPVYDTGANSISTPV